MTLAEALQKIGAEFDDISEDRIIDVETMLLHRGASLEELESEVSRIRAEHASERQRLLRHVSALLQTGAQEQ